jgi:hypothetical protein
MNRAQILYANAAQAEEQAITDTDPAKIRTLGISVVSAVSLHYKADQLSNAEHIACRWLGKASLPRFAVEQIRELLRTIWSEQVRQHANIGFAPGQVLVSIKGGEIVEGGAPLDLIVEKVQTVQALFYRTAEMLRGLPHRLRGGPSRDVVESCRPWLFQTAPGSYQFAVAVQEPRQHLLFEINKIRPMAVADYFMRILRAGIEDPDVNLPDIVPDAAYRTTFLKLTRNLSPTGKTFGLLEVRSASETSPVRLSPETRRSVSQAIRSAQPSGLTSEGEIETINGVLRAVHLDKDWIELFRGDEHIRINGVAETVDDVIGPMVNHAVTVQVVRPKRGNLRFRDIELDN